ncbi:hypothetical protein [Rhodanobacter denitrificans]|uniref:hypothetical protein n=1 Tax=Rhodanobacter denitrificans TaxID=666685 RepID=UPI001F2229FE|nr:hypothetical protein [Rhodanobacter denitrificans]UJJ60425.1 hypothetical protein LRK55_18470 [Rhodanobacter denitrificans]
MSTEQAQAPAPAETAPARPTLDRAAAAAAKRRRREEEATWRPDHSTPFWMYQLNLQTDKAAYVYHMALVKAQQSLYFFYHTLPDNVDVVAAAEKDINSRFELIEKQMGDELARIKALADSVAATPPTAYTKVETFQVAMYTPEARRFASMVETFDQLVQTLDVLWFAAAINRRTKSQLVQQYRNLLVAFAREIYVKSRRAKNAVRANRMLRDAERIERAKAKIDGIRLPEADANAEAQELAAA